MTNLRTLGLVMALMVPAFVLTAVPAPPALAQPDEVTRQPLVIETADGVLAFEVEMAATPQERARGLMFRTELPEDQGMLFDFGRPQTVRMWMRNTLIPLDMLFVDAAGTIVHVEHEAVPHSEEPRGPNGLVLAVIELAGGTARSRGLDVGDRVLHPLFRPAADTGLGGGQ